MNQRDLLTQHEQEERRVSDCCIGSYNDFQNYSFISLHQS
jgi:hypothetical protein